MVLVRTNVSSTVYELLVREKRLKQSLISIKTDFENLINS